MVNRRKMKFGMSDKIILSIGYTLLGVFALAILIPLVLSLIHILREALLFILPGSLKKERQMRFLYILVNMKRE